jgi:hypothetical protein
MLIFNAIHTPAYQYNSDNQISQLSIELLYIDRCALWGFTLEINSGISHVRYQFSPAGTTLSNYKCGGYIPCCVTVNIYTIVS